MHARISALRQFQLGVSCATVAHMERIGIRALERHANLVLRRVRRGQPLEVVERGHPVALLVPAQAVGIIDTLTASGRLTAAEGDLLELGPPLALKRGVQLPSARLARMREQER